MICCRIQFIFVECCPMFNYSNRNIYIINSQKGKCLPIMCKQRRFSKLTCDILFLHSSTSMSAFPKIVFTDLYINHHVVPCQQTINTCEIAQLRGRWVRGKILKKLYILFTNLQRHAGSNSDLGHCSSTGYFKIALTIHCKSISTFLRTHRRNDNFSVHKMAPSFVCGFQDHASIRSYMDRPIFISRTGMWS